MKKTVFNFFAIWDVYEEEAWLNKKAAEGWEFQQSTGYTYTFEKGEPGAYQYLLDLRDNDISDVDWQDYLNLLADSGIEVVSTFRDWVYLRRKTQAGEFTLYSDIDSRIGFWKKNIKKHLWIMLFPFFYFSVFSNYSGGADWANNIVAALSGMAALYLVYGLVKMYRIMKKLSAERLIHE